MVSFVAGAVERDARLAEDLAGGEGLTGEVGPDDRDQLLVLDEALRKRGGLVRVALAVLGQLARGCNQVARLVGLVDRVLDALVDRPTEWRSHRKARPWSRWSRCSPSGASSPPAVAVALIVVTTACCSEQHHSATAAQAARATVISSSFPLAKANTYSVHRTAQNRPQQWPRPARLRHVGRR